MQRSYRILTSLVAFAACFGFSLTRASAQPTFTDAEVLATTTVINGQTMEAGTDNSMFVFRAAIDPGAGNILDAPAPFVVIRPNSNDEPERGPYPPLAGRTFPMVPDPFRVNGWKIAVRGADMDGGSGTIFELLRVKRWSIVASNNTTGGVLMNGHGASPKPAGFLAVVKGQRSGIMPVDENFLPDKRSIPGQLGNGLRISPADPTSPNDGGSAHVYTWRVRITHPVGLPPQYFVRRGLQEWRDTRASWDQDPPFLNQWNSPVMLILVDPQGNRHYAPMEPDPEAPGNIPTDPRATYAIDRRFGADLYHPVGAGSYGSGAFYRFRMMPTQYIFNHGPVRGEGPFTRFGGPTLPDSLPAIPIGYGADADGERDPGIEVIGRPLANQYVAFAGPDRTMMTPFGPVQAPPHPFYTDTANRSGQWKYYYVVTTDFRAPQRPGFGTPNFVGGNTGARLQDLYGGDPDAYFQNVDSDVGLNPGDPNFPYLHPLVTPILSDGAWTDDIVENGYPGASRDAHRSRVTTKTRVRFQVRVTKADNTPLPAQAVRVFIDGVPNTMNPLPVPGNNDFLQGIVFHYDTTFPEGRQGRHWIFFQVDDGIHQAIWPRRDHPNSPLFTGDNRYPDLQARVLLNTVPGAVKGTAVNFGTGTVGLNYLDEPYVNNRPVLSNPTVSPSSGVEQQPFTYEVSFFDADGDEPVDAFVVIDGAPHRMTAVNNTPTNNPGGRRYRFVLSSLVPTPDRVHRYHFRFRDNWNSGAHSLIPYNVSNIRREWGEWQTLPAGDDNGVPATEIQGPTITTNRAPELYDAEVFASDPAHTAATLWDVAVRYRDADNEAPASLNLFISDDGGVTYTRQFAMVKAENSNNYAAGVQYHLATRIRLPVGNNYRFKFTTSDGLNDTTLMREGTGFNSITNNTAETLVPFGGSATVFESPEGHFKWDSNPAGIFVWRVSGGTATLLTLNTDYTVDFANGRVTLAQPIQSGQTVRASYYFLEQDFPDVRPNALPTLTEPVPTPPGDPNTNNGTLTPLSGGLQTTFTYAIIYTDADNQAPVDSQGNVNSVDLYVDGAPKLKLQPATQPPFDYTRGVRFQGTLTGSALGVGTHTYHFETTDGADIARFPAAGAPNPELSGPSVSDIGSLQLPPTTAFPNEVAIRPFPKGKSTDQYVFTVVYQSPSGVAPQFPIELRVRDNATGTITNVPMTPIDPIGPAEYQRGVRYQVQLQAPNSPLTMGAHDITFGFKDQPASTTPRTLIVNAPPVLSQDPANPLVSPNPASQAGDIVFSVRYTDPNGDPPVRAGQRVIRLMIDGTEFTAVQPTLTPASPSPQDFMNGVLYQWRIEARNLALGTHTFQFLAQDDVEDAAPLPPTPGSFTIQAAAQPVLSPAAVPVNPTAGARSGQYEFCVNYRHPDNVPPVTIDVIISNPSTGPITLPLTPKNGPPANFTSDVLYCVMSAPNTLDPGPHTFTFRVTDRLATVTLPAQGGQPFVGPTINSPPALSNGTVFLQGASTFPTINAQNVLTPNVQANITNNVIFQVVYSDPEGAAPPANGYVRVVLDNGTIIPMRQVSGTNFVTGVTYQTDPQTLPPGVRTFHFEASDGFDTARLPVSGEISGLNVANIPVLEPINATGDDGTLTPRTGPLSTTFTYRVRYKHADNVAPQAVRVIIDEGTANAQTQTMRLETPNVDYRVGGVFVHTVRFTSGATHTYRFEAQDGITPYIAKFPANGTSITGPVINLPVFASVAFNPTTGVAGAPMTITGQLVTNPNQGAQPLAIQIIAPDGTGQNFNVTTNADGTFTFNFTPDQTGEFKVKLSWAGVAGVFDPITSEFPFRVTGVQIPIAAGQIDMIALPLIPTTPDPALTFNPQRPDGTPLPITVLNLIKWLPTLGRYVSLNADSNFPGITAGQSYWTKPTESVVLNPRGRLADQTQPFVISLQPGWNMIGTVYLQNINWGATTVRFQGQEIPIASAANIVRPTAWGYDKSTGSYFMVQGNGVLEPMRGYWVRALQAAEIVLMPPGTRAADVSREGLIDRATSLQIMARSGNRADTDNFVALSGATKSRLALMDKPPYPGDYVSVRLLDPETVTLPDAARAVVAGQTVIPFQVETDRKNADVTVQFPNYAMLGRKYDVTVVDLATGVKRGVGSNGGYTYNSGAEAAPRRFALLVSAQTNSGRLIISELRATSRGTTGTSFSFNLSASSNLRAQIVGGNGRVVRDIAQGRAVTRGVNQLLWDGKNAQGVSVPAGAYVLKLTATDESGRQATAAMPITLVR